MADITSIHTALSADTVATQTFASYCKPTIINRSAAGYIYVTVDGSTPTVEGAGTIVVPPGVAWKSHVPTKTVKLISATADNYSVQGES